jgi:L-alanine-DL-glutamate epimerase-like enolase superfamily enzyme
MTPLEITLADFTPRFRGDGYVMSYVTQKVLYSRILRLDTDDGRVGYGEIISDPGLNLPEIRALEDVALKALEMASLEKLPAHIPRLRSLDVRLPGLAFALETAYLDLISRHNGLPLHALLGGQQCNDVVDYLSISCAEPDVMAERVQLDGHEREVIQIKLDGKDMHMDMARIDASMSALQPSQTMLIDFNGALAPATARAMISQYSDKRIMWEEPCYSYEENRALVDSTGARLLFDQCIKSLNDFARACEEGAMAGVCIKPMSLGGLAIARAARDMCADSGIAVRIDGLWCGPVAAASILHLAVGMPAKLLIAGCDLREPLVLEEDWGGMVTKPGGRIAPTDKPGHGVTPPMMLWR